MVTGLKVSAIENLRQVAIFLKEAGGLLPVQMDLGSVCGSDGICDADCAGVKGRNPICARWKLRSRARIHNLADLTRSLWGPRSFKEISLKTVPFGGGGQITGSDWNRKTQRDIGHENHRPPKLPTC